MRENEREIIEREYEEENEREYERKNETDKQKIRANKREREEGK